MRKKLEKLNLETYLSNRHLEIRVGINSKCVMTRKNSINLLHCFAKRDRNCIGGCRERLSLHYCSTGENVQRKSRHTQSAWSRDSANTNLCHVWFSWKSHLGGPTPKPRYPKFHDSWSGILNIEIFQQKLQYLYSPPVFIARLEIIIS